MPLLFQEIGIEREFGAKIALVIPVTFGYRGEIVKYWLESSDDDYRVMEGKRLPGPIHVIRPNFVEWIRGCEASPGKRLGKPP